MTWYHLCATRLAAQPNFAAQSAAAGRSGIEFIALFFGGDRDLGGLWPSTWGCLFVTIIPIISCYTPIKKRKIGIVNSAKLFVPPLCWARRGTYMCPPTYFWIGAFSPTYLFRFCGRWKKNIEKLFDLSWAGPEVRYKTHQLWMEGTEEAAALNQ